MRLAARFALVASLIIAAWAYDSHTGSQALAAEESVQQMALLGNTEFVLRAKYLMIVQARTVLAEPLATQYHSARVAFARAVLNGIPTHALTMLAGGINVVTATVYDTPTNTAYCTATDGAILSQIATFWNAMAGIETGT